MHIFPVCMQAPSANGRVAAMQERAGASALLQISTVSVGPFKGAWTASSAPAHRERKGKGCTAVPASKGSLAGAKRCLKPARRHPFGRLHGSKEKGRLYRPNCCRKMLAPLHMHMYPSVSSKKKRAFTNVRVPKDLALA
eukprot:1141321-Pelagomonas_calceolata.AAC.3